MKPGTLRWIILLAIGAALVAAWNLGIFEELELGRIKARQAQYQGFVDQSPLAAALIFYFVYTLSTALSIPGATLLTLLGGALFGLGWGTFMVSISSTSGAVLSFLMSRHLLRDWVTERFRDRIKPINEGFDREGSFYVFTLRLVPLFPFFLVNLLLGLTSVRLGTYTVVSLVGMLPGTLAYVNAGAQLSQLNDVRGLLSPSLLASFAVLGIVPMISKRFVEWIRNRRVYRGFKRPRRFDYNLVAIGGGSAGLVTAYIAAAVKAKVALIEKNRMGGDCLNTGCVPSKALIRAGKAANALKHAGDFGIEVMTSKVDFPKVMARVRSVITSIEPHDSVERYTQLGVECIRGHAKVVSPWEIRINDRTITTRNIVLATGAEAVVPPIPGIEDAPYRTNENFWEIEKQPESLLVIGGGPIGCEISQAMARLGTRVTLVERSGHLLAREDLDVSRAVESALARDGVQLKLNSEIKLFSQSTVGPQWRQARFLDGSQVDFDLCLVAIGRRARTKGFGAEELGLKLKVDGTFDVDPYLRTQYPNVFVCGDAAGPYQFTHVAAHQAWYASVNALFQPFRKFAVDYRVIPRVTFTDPEVAQVGVSEKEASEQKLNFEVTSYHLDDLDRAIAEGEAHGFIKVLTKKGSDQILGVTIVGHEAGNLLSEMVLAMKHGLGLNKILSTIHSYPTMAEANKYVAGQWKRLHAPEQVLRWVARFHQWRRG